MKRHILFILTLLLFFYAKSQPNCIFTHYSSENGLSQNSIMSVVQDHNGVLWGQRIFLVGKLSFKRIA